MMTEPDENLKEFVVTLINTVYYEVTVEAECEDEAIATAMYMVDENEDDYIHSYDGLEFTNIR